MRAIDTSDTPASARRRLRVAVSRGGGGLAPLGRFRARVAPGRVTKAYGSIDREINASGGMGRVRPQQRGHPTGRGG